MRPETADKLLIALTELVQHATTMHKRDDQGITNFSPQWDRLFNLSLQGQTIIAEARAEKLADECHGYDVDGRPLAIVACEKLVRAYRNGATANDCVDWEDVDEAHVVARAALGLPANDDDSSIPLSPADAAVILEGMVAAEVDEISESGRVWGADYDPFADGGDGLC